MHDNLHSIVVVLLVTDLTTTSEQKDATSSRKTFNTSPNKRCTHCSTYQVNVLVNFQSRPSHRFHIINYYFT